MQILPDYFHMTENKQYKMKQDRNLRIELTNQMIERIEIIY